MLHCLHDGEALILAGRFDPDGALVLADRTATRRQMQARRKTCE
jgi:hypothetical protein